MKTLIFPCIQRVFIANDFDESASITRSVRFLSVIQLMVHCLACAQVLATLCLAMLTVAAHCST